MSRGRGRGGRGGPRGGGFGSNGKLDSRGGGHQWSGGGRVLDETFAASRGGRGGRGRGGATRGMGMRASGQNAVGFDYGTPQRSGEASPREGQDGEDESEEEDDIVIDTHRSYKHTIKPELEQNEAPIRHAAPTDSGINTLLPPSVADMHARAPSNLVALERAQRVMEGQVAGLIPTGPKSAHVHRMYGTLDTVYQRNQSRKQQQGPQQQFPLPVSAQAKDRKGKGKGERPAENSTEDPCLAGIPRSTPRRGGGEKEKFFGRGGGGGNLQVPIQFQKASGEWKDGAWVREADGKQIAPSSSQQTEGGGDSLKQPANPFDHPAGAGLGFHQAQGAPAAAPLPDDKWAMEREEHDEDNDPIAALLKAHPGSKEMDEDTPDDGFGYYQSSFAAAPRERMPETEDSSASLAEDLSKGDDVFVDRVGKGRIEEASSEDEDVILIPHTHAHGKPGQTAVSDSEEERQLDAIIEHGQGIEDDRPDEEGEQNSFFIDLTGQEEGAKGQTVRFEAEQTTVIGEQSVPQVAEGREEWGSEEEDEINLTQRQPRGPGKKARNAAKKARRRAKKGDDQMGKEAPVPREGDSDLEWGSDGPPVQFKREEDQEDFVQSGALQSLNLNGVKAPRNGREEDEMLALALSKSVEEHKKPSSQKKDARVQNAKDAILADYMENAMGVADEDEEDVVSEKRDERMANKRTDLDAMLQFMNGMDGQRQGREMTMEDIAIENQMQEEDEWMTETESGEEDRVADAAIRREEGKVMQDESGDSDDSGDSDRREQRKTGWDDSSDEEDSDEDGAFDRNFSWADQDEDFIDRLDKFARTNEAILKGRDRGARNRLFKAIESGDFGMLDDDDMVIDNEDPVFGLGGLQPAKKGKKPWKKDDLWAAELQEQWDKDRARKADNKRKRAAERALAAENPFHAQVKRGTKKMAKKAARAERRASRSAGGRLDEDDEDDDEEEMEDVAALSRHASNLVELDEQIQLFLRDHGKTTLSLAPMDKRARAQVHLLANCYNLISKSKGNGNKRFPTLIKNQRSGYNVNVKKINGILRGASGSFGSLGGRGAGARGGDRAKVKDRASGVGAHVPKNQEGSAVGFGAERIGEENVGHRLLTMMGWSEGAGVGLTRGAADPVGATIKVTKSGLGF